MDDSDGKASLAPVKTKPGQSFQFVIFEMAGSVP